MSRFHDGKKGLSASWFIIENIECRGVGGVSVLATSFSDLYVRETGIGHLMVPVKSSYQEEQG